MKGATKKAPQEQAVNYEVKVTRAKEVSEGNVAFDMLVNGIFINGCWYKEGTSKAGKDYEIISFPQRKGSDGNYYNHVWFKIEDDLKADIIKQLQELV